MPRVERFFVLAQTDNLWKEHLQAIKFLQQAVSLRGYAQVSAAPPSRRHLLACTFACRAQGCTFVFPVVLANSALERVVAAGSLARAPSWQPLAAVLSGPSWAFMLSCFPVFLLAEGSAGGVQAGGVQPLPGDDGKPPAPPCPACFFAPLPARRLIHDPSTTAECLESPPALPFSFTQAQIRRNVIYNCYMFKPEKVVEQEGPKAGQPASQGGSRKKKVTQAAA